MTDEETIAILAAGAQREMNGLFSGSQDARNMNQNRTDWRRILGQRMQQRGNPNMPQQPFQPQFFPPNPNYPQPQQRNAFPPIDDGMNQYGDTSIPQEVPANIRQIPLPPLPKDENGNPIIPPELKEMYGMAQQQNNPNLGLDIGGFNVPQYNQNNPPQVSAAVNIKIEEKYDNIIKEIKLLKRAINTLTNLLKKSKVIEDPELPKSESTTTTENSEIVN